MALSVTINNTQFEDRPYYSAYHPIILDIRESNNSLSDAKVQVFINNAEKNVRLFNGRVKIDISQQALLLVREPRPRQLPGNIPNKPIEDASGRNVMMPISVEARIAGQQLEPLTTIYVAPFPYDRDALDTSELNAFYNPEDTVSWAHKGNVAFFTPGSGARNTVSFYFRRIFAQVVHEVTFSPRYNYPIPFEEINDAKFRQFIDPGVSGEDDYGIHEITIPEFSADRLEKIELTIANTDSNGRGILNLFPLRNRCNGTVTLKWINEYGGWNFAQARKVSNSISSTPLNTYQPNSSSQLLSSRDPRPRWGTSEVEESYTFTIDDIPVIARDYFKSLLYSPYVFEIEGNAEKLIKYGKNTANGSIDLSRRDRINLTVTLPIINTYGF